ncbi:hypothetical protein VZC37_13080 [Gordonia sp. LSe1-13]|uniref:Uncharacterized protein n=1 Tax=Gordonia sesuvii TaxID=3116777 RepID=A0ABU7MDU7_9ACTN|nr:hypothetical protein [Gordonia sp. LSe1-13]
MTYQDIVYGWPTMMDRVLDAVHGGHHLAPRRRKLTADITGDGRELDYPIDPAAT